ncbi:hypothetical protein EG329_010816 [Mollisiaceae sp. DMI_Dod_QoI]|nr:hypothetical protein EG329_010816 [Helotiales sp. DMI_Dod_QoI]
MREGYGWVEESRLSTLDSRLSSSFSQERRRSRLFAWCFCCMPSGSRPLGPVQDTSAEGPERRGEGGCETGIWNTSQSQSQAAGCPGIGRRITLEKESCSSEKPFGLGMQRNLEPACLVPAKEVGGQHRDSEIQQADKDGDWGDNISGRWLDA